MNLGAGRNHLTIINHLNVQQTLNEMWVSTSENQVHIETDYKVCPSLTFFLESERPRLA